MEVTRLVGNKKKHRKQASKKQMIAIALHSQGLSKADSMRKAGYSPKSLQKPSQVFTSQAIVTAVDKLKLELKDIGLTTEYIAYKLKELLEADKLDKQDYNIQLKALDMLKQILIDQELKQPINTNITKTITLTEYLQPNHQLNHDVTVLDPLQDHVGTNNIDNQAQETQLIEDIQEIEETREEKKEKTTETNISQELEELII